MGNPAAREQCNVAEAAGTPTALAYLIGAVTLQHTEVSGLSAASGAQCIKNKEVSVVLLSQTVSS